MLDLTVGPSFKVKRCFTGFGELSFWWIPIYTGSVMHRSSLLRMCNRVALYIFFYIYIINIFIL